MTRLLPLFLAAAILGIVKGQTVATIPTTLSSSPTTHGSPSSGTGTTQKMTTTTQDPKEAIKDAATDVDLKCTPKSQDCDPQKSAVISGVPTLNLEELCKQVKNYTTCMNEKCDKSDAFKKAVEKIEEPCDGSDFLRPSFLVILLLVAMLNLI